MMLGHYIAIKSCFNDNYLSIANDSQIIFNQKNINNCYILIMRYEGKYVTFQDRNKIKYLSYDAFGNCLELNKDIPGESERFEIEWINEDLFALKAYNGFYISVINNGIIDVSKKNISINEKFSMTEQKEENLFEFLGFI